MTGPDDQRPSLGWADPAGAAARTRLAQRRRVEQIRDAAVAAAHGDDADRAGVGQLLDQLLAAHPPTQWTAEDWEEFDRGVRDARQMARQMLVQADDARVISLVDLDGDGQPSVLERAISDGNEVSDLDWVDWGEVTDRIDERLAEDYDWPTLSATLDRAAAAGYDLASHLPALAADPPLPDQHPARELAYRVMTDCPAAIADPVPPAGTGAATGSAAAPDPAPEPASSPAPPGPGW